MFYGGIDITALSDDKLTTFRKENIGFIFQQYYLLPNMDVDKNVKMGADLADNKDYKEVIERSVLEKNYTNIRVSFQVANSKEFLLQEHWRKSQRYCFLMSRQVH